MLTIYSKKHCNFCLCTKQFLSEAGIAFREIDIEQDQHALEFIKSEGHQTVPQIYWEGQLFVDGGWTGLSTMGVEQILHKIELRDTRSLGTL